MDIACLSFLSPFLWDGNTNNQLSFQLNSGHSRDSRATREKLSSCLPADRYWGNKQCWNHSNGKQLSLYCESCR